MMKMHTLSLAWTLPIILAAVACGGGDPNDTDENGTTAVTADPGTTTTTATPTTTGDETSAGSSGSTGAQEVCVDDDLMDSKFAGPGYDADNGGLQAPLQDSYFVSTTWVKMRPEQELQNQFLGAAAGLVPVLLANPGLIGYSLATSDKCTYARTLTVWRTQEDMLDFFMTAEHQEAMASTSKWVTFAVGADWTAEAAQIPPTWDEARTQVEDDPPYYQE